MSIRAQRILLVDDEPMVLAVAGTVLDREGYHVVRTTNPLDAIHLAAGPEGTPDLLLTDVTMPGMNGPHLADAVLRACPAIRILFMTGHPESLDREHGIPPGSSVLRKPFRIEELVERVRVALTLRSNQAA